MRKSASSPSGTPSQESLARLGYIFHSGPTIIGPTVEALAPNGDSCGLSGGGTERDRMARAVELARTHLAAKGTSHV